MEDRELAISITVGAVVKILAILAIAWVLFMVRDIVLVVLTAIVIASAVEPGVAVLMRRKIPRAISVMAVYFSMLTAFFGVFYFFIPSLVADFATFVTIVPSYLDQIVQNSAVDQYAQIFGVQGSHALSSADILASVRSALHIDQVFGNTFSAIVHVFGGVFSSILIFVFSFYFAVFETGVDDFLRIVTPRKHQTYVLGLWRRSQTKIGLWMQGQLLLAFLIGIIVYLGLTILGVPHALVLSVIAAMFEIIPVFGPILAALPGIAIAFVSGGMSLGLLTIGLYTIAQQFESHLIYPLVVSRVIGVPPLLVILALIVGAELAGFLGIILSVPAAAILQELAHDIETGRLARHEEAVS